MKPFIAIAIVLTLMLLAGPIAAQTTLEKLYVIECGERTAPDVSPWPPGVNVGQPVDFVDTCYLIKHGNDWMVWDTGLADAVFTTPSADPNAWKRKNSLAGELEKLSVKPSDIKYVAVSHTHGDHIGNVELFHSRCCWCRRPNTIGLNRTANRAFCRHIPSGRLKATTTCSAMAA